MERIFTMMKDDGPLQSRRQFLRKLGLCSISLTAASASLKCSDSRDRDRPNFIIFIADDVGWNDIGAYGHPTIRTTHIDRLAEEGIRFDSAFLTTSSCSPSRSSIMTGLFPHSTNAGELHQPLPENKTTFPGLLKSAGYFTASAGKWHLGKSPEKDFDRIEGGRPSGCEMWLDVLRDRPKDRPFFLWLASVDAHRNWSATEGEHAIDEPHRPEDAVIPPFLPDHPETRQDLAKYYDEISRLDRNIGQVLEELERQDGDNNTWVLFMSDNGRPFPRCKTTLHDSGIQTPFIIRWPKQIVPGSKADGLVSSVDIAPTILELAGLPVPENMQGRSFSKILNDHRAKTQDYIFAEHNWHDYQAHERAVRSERYLYINNAFPNLPATPPADAVRSPTYQNMQKLRKTSQLKPEHQECFNIPRPREMLFDLRIDPFSMNNLAGLKKYDQLLQQFRQKYSEWKSRTLDRIPENPTPDRFDRDHGTRLEL